jgi:tetratricopeptide (TPR) repeat protein
MTATLTMQGIRALTRGDEEGALEAFGLALEGSGDHFEARLCRARLLVMRRRYDEAEEALAELAGEAPESAEARDRAEARNHAEAWLLLGIAQRERFRLYDAVDSFRAAALLDPLDGRAGAALRELLEVQEP